MATARIGAVYCIHGVPMHTASSGGAQDLVVGQGPGHGGAPQQGLNGSEEHRRRCDERPWGCAVCEGAWTPLESGRCGERPSRPPPGHLTPGLAVEREFSEILTAPSPVTKENSLAHLWIS